MAGGRDEAQSHSGQRDAPSASDGAPFINPRSPRGPWQLSQLSSNSVAAKLR